MNILIIPIVYFPIYSIGKLNLMTKFDGNIPARRGILLVPEPTIWPVNQSSFESITFIISNSRKTKSPGSLELYGYIEKK